MDSRMNHLGCPVLYGDKWIGNKWVRWQEQVLLILGFSFCSGRGCSVRFFPLLRLILSGVHFQVFPSQRRQLRIKWFGFYKERNMKHTKYLKKIPTWHVGENFAHFWVRCLIYVAINFLFLVPISSSRTRAKVVWSWWYWRWLGWHIVREPTNGVHR